MTQCPLYDNTFMGVFVHVSRNLATAPCKMKIFLLKVEEEI